MLPTNGSSQLPVASITRPNTSGERIAASAEPVFIKPLAVPENFGAMSMGIAHIGPIVNSAKKNAEASATTATSVVTNRTGTKNASEQSMPKITRSRRAGSGCRCADTASR